MDNRKDDRYYLDRLQAELQVIARHMDGVTEEAFSGNELLQDAMMFRLIQVSETARKLSDAFKSGRTQVPWNAVYGLRNRIVHDYGAVDMHIIFTTLAKDIPELMKLLGM